jgi:hypothetical protein
MTRSVGSVSLYPGGQWNDVFGGAASHGQPPQGRSFRPSAVLVRFDELKVGDSRLLGFDSDLETGHLEPKPYISLAASRDNDGIDGHKHH